MTGIERKGREDSEALEKDLGIVGKALETFPARL